MKGNTDGCLELELMKLKVEVGPMIDSISKNVK